MIEVQAVHREVTAPRVLLEGAVDVVPHDAPIDPHVLRVTRSVVETRAECRDLDDLPAHAHMREPEPPSDEATASKQAADGVRGRAGRDVEVLGLEAQQQIANASADEKSLMAGVGQRVQYFEGPPTDVGVGDAMLRMGDDGGLGDGSCDPGRFQG